MGFPTALQAGDYLKLRAGGHKASQFLLLGSNTVVFASRVTHTHSDISATSTGQILLHDPSDTGAYTDVLEGMTILISATNDPRAAYFVGRVRADNSGVVSSATFVNCNETSATITSGDYIFVIRDYRLFHELGRYTGGVYYKDYQRTFIQLRPIIYGLQSVYAGIVSGSPVGFTVAFAAQAIAATSGATISSYTYTLPSGATVTAGATNTANVTVRFDASAAEYWVKLLVTDSGGRTQTRYMAVFSIPANLSTTVSLGTNGANITGDVDNGFNCSIDVFTGFSSVYDNTLAAIVDVEYYATTQTSIVSAVKFVGRMRTDTDATQASETISVSHKATVEIEGAAAQMARISTPLITMRDATSASVWDEITKLTVWRSIAYLLEHSTFHELYSLTFDSTADTFYAYQLAAQQGNLLSGVNDLYKSINGALEYSPTGEVRSVRNLNFLTTAERSALTVVADFTPQDWINFSLAHPHVQTVGLVEASGASYNRTGGILAAMVIPKLSVAPGVAQGNADGVSPLPGQILSANVTAAAEVLELNTRAGNQFATANDSDQLTVDFRTGYNWIVPSRYQYYTFTIAASDDTFGRAYSTADRWWCKSMSVRHDNVKGIKQVQGVFVLESSGDDAGASGQNVPIPPPAAIPPVLPSIPPVVAYPYFPPDPSTYLPDNPTPDQIPPFMPTPSTTNGVPVDGNAVMIHNTTSVWVTRDFIGSPHWADVTPPYDDGFTVRDAALVAGDTRAFVLVYNSTTNESILYTIANVFDSSGVWTAGATLTDEYTTIQPTSTAGAVYLRGVTTTGSNPADAWTIITGTETSRTATTITGDAVFGGGSWRISISATGYYGVVSPSDLCRELSLSRIPGGLIGYWPCGSGIETIALYSGQCIGSMDYVDTVSFSCTFTLAIDPLCGTSSVSGSQTVYSTDNGATWAAPVSIGTVDGGIDAERIGVPVIVGSESQVRIATSAGGAYSDYGSATPTGTEPTALLIPRKTFAGGDNVTTTTPNYLMASNVLGSSNKSLLKATSSGGTFTDITPSNGGNYFLAVSPRCIAMSWWTSSKIALIGLFGSLPRLMTSTNASAFTDRGVLDTSATMVTFRRGDTTSNQLFGCAGQPFYSPDFGATVVLKSVPADTTTDPILNISVYG